MGRQAGEIRIFAAERGKTLFAPGRGKGYCKIAKRAPKMHFLREFWKFCHNMCNFAFLRQVSSDFYLQYGKNFLMTRGGNKNFLGQGKVNEVPAGGGSGFYPSGGRK